MHAPDKAYQEPSFGSKTSITCALQNFVSGPSISQEAL